MYEFFVYPWNIKKVVEYLLDNNIEFQVWKYSMGIVAVRLTHNPEIKHKVNVQRLNPFQENTK